MGSSFAARDAGTRHARNAVEPSKEYDRSHRQRVGPRDLEHFALQEASQRHASSEPDGETDEHQPASHGEHEGEHVAPIGAEGHTDADFMRAPRARCKTTRVMRKVARASSRVRRPEERHVKAWLYGFENDDIVQGKRRVRGYLYRCRDTIPHSIESSMGCPAVRMARVRPGGATRV